MNIKNPDYKEQAENLRQTLLNYINCMEKVQTEQQREIVDLKQTAELYKAIIFERDKKIKAQLDTIEDLYSQIHEAAQEVQDYNEMMEDEQTWRVALAKENEKLKQENKELDDQFKKASSTIASLIAKIHELETILYIYEGKKHE